MMDTLLRWLLVLSAFSGYTHAATYHVDAAAGNDADPGTADQPWQTLGRTYTWYTGTETPVVREGDTVLFRDGTYGDSLGFRESTRENPGTRWLLYRNDWVTYKAADGAFPALSRINIRNEDKWDVIEHGRSRLVFDGFRIDNGVGLTYTSNVVIRNCVIVNQPVPYDGFHAPYYYPNTYGISSRYAHHITIEDCDISATYRGISPYGTNWTIRNNHIHDIAEDGINGLVDTMVLDGNLMHETNARRTTVDLHGTGTGEFVMGERVVQSGTGAEGIVYQYVNGYLQVWQTTETSFQSTGGGGGAVTGQESGAMVSDVTRTDGAHVDGIHIESASVHDITITRNVVYGMNAQGISLYGHGGMTDVVLGNNLVYDVTKTLVICGVDGMDIYNNTTYNGYVRMECTSNHPYVTTVDNMYNNVFTRLNIDSDAGGGYIRIVSHGNNILGNDPDGSGTAYPFTVSGTELANTVPEFADTAARDFRLTAGSTARDFGNAAYAPETDIAGAPRDAAPDAGCYEYVASHAVDHGPRIHVSSVPLLSNPITVGDLLSSKILTTGKLYFTDGRPVRNPGQLTAGVYLAREGGNGPSYRTVLVK